MCLPRPKKSSAPDWPPCHLAADASQVSETTSPLVVVLLTMIVCRLPTVHAVSALRAAMAIIAFRTFWEVNIPPVAPLRCVLRQSSSKVPAIRYHRSRHHSCHSRRGLTALSSPTSPCPLQPHSRSTTSPMRRVVSRPHGLRRRSSRVAIHLLRRHLSATCLAGVERRSRWSQSGCEHQMCRDRVEWSGVESSRWNE